MNCEHATPDNVGGFHCAKFKLNVSRGVCIACKECPMDWRAELLIKIPIEHAPEGWPPVVVPKKEMIQMQTKTNLPRLSFFEKLSNLKNSLQDWKNAGFPVASDELINQRREICGKCEFWTGYTCKKCGCTGLKWWLETSKCPIDKWPARRPK